MPVRIIMINIACSRHLDVGEQVNHMCLHLNAWNRLERLRTSSLTPNISMYTLHALLMVAFPVPGNN